MEGSADNLTLLFLGKLVEVNCIAGNTDCKIRVHFGIFVSLDKLFLVQYVYIDMVSVLAEIAVKDNCKVFDSCTVV